MRTTELLALLAFLSACGGQPTAPVVPSKLVFGILPTESSTDAMQRWQPLIGALSQAAGMPVEPMAVADYAALIEALRFEKADLAYLGPSAYVKAEARAGVEALAQERPLLGNPSYRALIVVRADDKAQTLDDLRGRSIAFADPNSTSGYLAPLVHFVEIRQEEPAAFFSEQTFSGSHQAVVLAVANSHVDAGATNEIDLARAVNAGSVRDGQLRAVWTSDPIPSSPIAIRKALPAELREKLRTALISYADEDGMTRMKNRGFAAVEEAAYDPVRRMEAVRAGRGRP